MNPEREKIKTFLPRVTKDCKFARLVNRELNKIIIKHLVNKAMDYFLYYDLEWNPIGCAIANDGITRAWDFPNDASMFYELEAEISDYLNTLV